MKGIAIIKYNRGQIIVNPSIEYASRFQYLKNLKHKGPNKQMGDNNPSDTSFQRDRVKAYIKTVYIQFEK